MSTENKGKRWTDEQLIDVLNHVPSEINLKLLMDKYKRTGSAITDIWWFCYEIDGQNQDRALYHKVRTLKSRLKIFDYLVGMGGMYRKKAVDLYEKNRLPNPKISLGKISNWKDYNIDGKEYFININTKVVAKEGSEVYNKILEAKTK